MQDTNVFFYSKKYWLWEKYLKIPIEDIDFTSINIKKYIIWNKPDIVNKVIAYCFELPFRTLTFNNYVDIENCVLFLLM